MKEMKVAGMGQYAANNQPMHSVLYLFALAGAPERTQAWVRLAMAHAFGPDFYAGDEDNGEMGSWFVLSALGVYPVAPGTRRWVIGSPLFRHVEIVYPAEMQRSSLHIIADDNAPQNVFVKKVGWVDGREITDSYVDMADLSRGGTLRMDMAAEPPAGTDVSVLPVQPYGPPLDSTAQLGHLGSAGPGAAAAAIDVGAASRERRSESSMVEELSKRLHVEEERARSEKEQLAEMEAVAKESERQRLLLQDQLREQREMNQEMGERTRRFEQQQRAGGHGAALAAPVHAVPPPPHPVPQPPVPAPPPPGPSISQAYVAPAVAKARAAAGMVEAAVLREVKTAVEAGVGDAKNGSNDTDDAALLLICAGVAMIFCGLLVLIGKSIFGQGKTTKHVA